MRVRSRLLAVLVAAVALVAAGCSGAGSQGSGQPGSEGPGEQVTLEFWTWAPGIEKAVDLWNRTHPDVQVKLSKIPTGGAGGYAKMHSAVQAGNAPDVATVEYQTIPSFLLEGELVDLSQYGADQHADKFVGWQWQQVGFGGTVYAIPQASAPMGLFYREDLFDEWGIEVPETWAEFEQAAREVRQADPDAYICTFPPGNSAWFTALAWQAGAQWFGTQGDTWTVNIDSPQTRKVAEYWNRLIEDDLIKTEPDFQTGWYKDLQEGHIVAWPSAQWGDAILRGNAPDTGGRWRVAPIPQWEDSGRFVSSHWGGSSVAVLKGSEHPEEALEFAIWLNTDPDSVDLLITGGYGWPAAKGAFEGSALDRADPFFGDQRYNEVFAEADQHIDTSWRWIPTMDATYQHLNKGFQQAVDGNGTLVDAVVQAQQQTVADLRAKDLQVRAG